MKKIKRYLQQQGWYLESKSLYDGKATLLGGNLLEGKMNLKKTVVFLIVCITFFSCDKFLEESPKDKLPEDEVYNNISDVYLNAVASLYTYIGGYSDSQGLQGTGRGVYDLNTFTTDEAIIPTRGGDWYDGGFWQGLFLHQWGIENDAIQATWEYLYKVVERDYDTYSGIILEKYFRQLFAESNEYSDIQGYWDNKGENEIDLIAVNDMEKRIVIGEVKRNAKRISLPLLERKAENIIKKHSSYQIEFRGFSLEDM